MKRIIPALIVILSLIAFLSCDIRFDVHEENPQLFSFMKLSIGGKPVTLSGGFENGIWYECADLDRTDPVEVSRGSDFETPSFSDAGIRYYYCEQDGQLSEVFCVGYTGLPTVVIDTLGKGITSKLNETEALLEVYDKKGIRQSNDSSITVRARGNSSWFMFEKKSLRIKFGSSQKMLGLSKSKKWVLSAIGWDSTYMGNWFGFRIAEEVFDNDWNPSAMHVDVIVDGIYMGNYTLTENVKISSKRINIQSLEEITDDVNGDGVVDINDGGFVIEISKIHGNTMPFTTPHGVPLSVKEPDREDLVDPKKAEYYIRNIANRVDEAIYDFSNDSYLDVFDLDSFVDWYLIYEFMSIRDAAFHMSCFAYYDPSDAKLHMGPVWDFDPYASLVEGSYFDNPDSLWVYQLLKRPEVRLAIKERWNSRKDALHSQFDAYTKEAGKIAVSAAMNQIRWKMNGFEDCCNEVLSILHHRFNHLNSRFNDPTYL